MSWEWIIIKNKVESQKNSDRRKMLISDGGLQVMKVMSKVLISDGG